MKTTEKTPSKKSEGAKRQQRQVAVEALRFTVTNDSVGKTTLKHIKELVRMHNAAEKAKAKTQPDYKPKVEHLKAIGRIGRNILIGPRYRKAPASPRDTKQAKHIAPLSTASTIDCYVYA